MAQKTKKEKLVTDLRRERLLFLSQTSCPTPNQGDQTNVYLRNDLAKSILLALLVLVIELVLYWQLS